MKELRQSLIAYYNNSGQIDEALPFYEILVNLASDHSDKPGLSFTQGHVAYIIVEAYHRSNQNEKAKSFAQKASDVLLSLDFFNLSNQKFGKDEAKRMHSFIRSLIEDDS